MFKKVFTILLIVSQIPLMTPSRWPDCKSKWPTCKFQKKENVVCTEPDCDPKDTCTEIPISADFRLWMLKGHNEKRDLVASGEEKRGGMVPVADMAALSYCLALEYTAMCNVHRCKFEHDKCRITEIFDTAGQNIAMAGKGRVTLNEDQARTLIDDWYEEVKLADLSSSIDNWQSVPGTGHFTAVIWAETTHIGCAWTLKNKTKGSSMEFVYLTCNYAPAGNFIGKRMFVKGDPCSQCPPGKSCGSTYKHLCGEENHKDLDGPNPYRVTELGKARSNSAVLLVLSVNVLMATLIC